MHNYENAVEINTVSPVENGNVMPNESLSELPQHIIDKHNGLSYELHGDYYFPLLLKPEDEPVEPIGKWGLMYHDHLKSEHPGKYAHLLLSGKLKKHLHEIDMQAKERFEILMEGYRQSWHITEELKAQNPMQWVGLMNNARSEAEDCIVQEIILG